MQTTTKTSGAAGSMSRPVVETAEQVAARVKNGAATAAMWGAGIGGVLFGFIIVLDEHLPAVKAALTLNKGVGSLSGKSTLGVIAWLISWAILHVLLRNRELAPRTIAIVTAVLVVLSILLTFPPIYMIGA